MTSSNTAIVDLEGSNSSGSGISEGGSALNDTSSVSASSLKKSRTIFHFGSSGNLANNTTSLQRIYLDPFFLSAFLVPIIRFITLLVFLEPELPATTIRNGDIGANSFPCFKGWYSSSLYSKYSI